MANDQEIHRLALEVVRLLNGLSVGQARTVISCADSLVQFGATFDIDAQTFQREVETYNERFGDRVAIDSGKVKAR